MSLPTDSGSPVSKSGSFRRAAQVVIVSSVMFTFISYWRTAAVVLCDLASTSYYIGAIVEQSIGPAAPWFILGVMLFSYAVRWVYIESCTLFVRGGVYRVVREALGRFFAKFAVAALMFDYILTGPISGVTAGQYIIGLAIEVLTHQAGVEIDKPTRDAWKSYGSMLIAAMITLYFFRKNLIGIHESSEKALKIMMITTVMAVIMLGWCGITLLTEGPAQNQDGSRNAVPLQPNLQPKPNYSTDPPKIEDPRGFLSHTQLGESLGDLHGDQWLGLIGCLGLFIAFGHSILAMSGEETLAQVYREIESPKLPNFRRAAFIVFVYSLCLTATISFFAVLLIPNDVRMTDYSDNLIGGLAMNVLGPLWLRLILNAFVVVVGFLILAGAVNTAIIGSNGVLNRVAEDGVLTDWFLKPHPRYGTTYRILWMIFILQLINIIASRGDVIWLGEAYAFGVIWSFVFQAVSMVVLRFKDPRPREFKVPLNIRVGSIEVPVGLLLILVVLLMSAVMNLLTKETATIGGLSFTGAFFVMFWLSERYHEQRRTGREHLEQFNRQTTSEVTAASLGMNKSYRKLVAIRSPQNLFMLEKALAETDPETTGVVVLTAKLMPTGEALPSGEVGIDSYDQQLMTAVVQRAELAGKQVKPLIVPTNNPLYAVLNTAKDIQANELIMGASNKYTADEQMEQIAFYWISIHEGNPPPLTVRILSRDRDMYLDLAGGNRIPKISERRARSVAELRAAGVGVDRVLLVHDGTPGSSDLFQGVLTMLDPQVALAMVPVIPVGSEPLNGHNLVQQDKERAEKLGRELKIYQPEGAVEAEIVRLAHQDQYDLIILPLPGEMSTRPGTPLDSRSGYILRHAHCRVFLAGAPGIPQEVVDTTPSQS